MCAKSLFWQRFYTTESKLKGSYQQTLLKNPSLYLRGKYFHIPSASRETGRHKLPVHARTHTHLNHRLSSRLPPHTKQQQLRLKCFWGYGNPIRAGHASISTPRWSENILAKCLSTALHIPSRSHAYFDCSTEAKVTRGHPAQGASFHLQSVRSIPGIKEWRKRERERLCVWVCECVCVCVTERDCDAPTYRWGAGHKGKYCTNTHFFFLTSKMRTYFSTLCPT